MAMNARYRGYTIGGHLQMLRAAWICGFLLHPQERGHKLKTIHDPVVDFTCEQLCLFECLPRLSQSLYRGKPKFQLIHHQRCKILQILNLSFINGSWLLVDDAQRSKVVTVARTQRHASIESQTELAGDQRISERPNVFGGVAKNVGIRSQDG